MNRVKLLRSSIELATSLTSTQQTRLNSFSLIQVTRFSQLTQFSPFSPSTNPHPSYINPNSYRNSFFLSNSQSSFVDFILSNDWCEEIEIELQKMNPKLSHESVVYALIKLSENPQKCFDFFRWVCVRKLFRVNYVHYSILIKCLASKYFLDKFWVVAFEMRELGFYIDNQVYQHVYANLKRENLVTVAVEWTEFHKFVCKNFVGIDDVNYVVKLIKECEWSEEVKKKLSKKLEFPLSENFMIKVLRDLWKRPLRALEFFKWVESFGGFVRDGLMCNEMLKVLARGESIIEFWELVGWMKNEGFEVDLDSYLKIVKLDHLPSLYAVKLFEVMMDGPYKLSSHECSLVLKTICLDHAPDMELAYRAVNKYVDAGNTLSKKVYDGMHRILCKLGRLHEARKIVQEMRSAGFEPDNVSYSQEIFGLCAQKRLGEACNAFHRMEQHGCVPDIKTWTILLQGFCAAKQVDHALSCFARMIKKNIETDAEVVEVLINGFVSEGKVFDAYRFLVEMVKNGRIKPWQSTYKLTIEKLAEIGKLGEALNLVNMMRKHGYSPFPDPIVQYVSRFGTVENAKKFIWAQSIHGIPSTAAYVWMITSFMGEGREAEAKHLLDSSPKSVRNQNTILKLFEKTTIGQ